MRNIEKYKDIVLDNMNICDIDTLLRGKCTKEYRAFCEGFNCEGCRERFLKWLLEEYEEPVLDEVERKYLSDVIKPFGHRVSYIVKKLNGSGYYIAIIVNNFDVMNLPYFTRNTMYKGMEVNRKYKLKELGL